MSSDIMEITKGTSLLDARDLEELETLGISQQQVESQIQMFKQGIPCTTLSRTCRLGDGITSLSPSQIKDCGNTFYDAASSGRIMKFVPASGAASRMFKSLLVCLEQYIAHANSQSGFQWEQAEQRVMEKFLDNLALFPFTAALLAQWPQDPTGSSPQEPNQHGGHLLEMLLTSKGLNYASLPKALLQFHQYDDHVRTPLEEHLVEAQAYARDHEGIARMHCTVSPEHELGIKHFLQKIMPQYSVNGVKFNLGFSLQKASTNTIAADMENRIFRDLEDRMVFRPGGHGALIENLNDLQGDIIFIKNVDNVVPDHMKDTSLTWKRILGGHLISVQECTFTCIKSLKVQHVTPSVIEKVCTIAKEKLCLEIPTDFKHWDTQAQSNFLIEKFNRPIRVCGMVKNVGEAGGGPFWVQEENGISSLQIIESSQVDPQSLTQQELFNSSTHFNPVDIVCGVRDYQGKLFDLRKFTDPKTGFIAKKSYQGRDLQALELPGLWNGGMANWNTIFVDVPLSTFNPVKTVFDLLRPEHQPPLHSSKHA